MPARLPSPHLSEAPSAFIGTAFNSATGDEAVEGSLSVDLWRLRFESPTLVLEMPLTRVQLELDEAAGGRLEFTDPEQPGWSISSFDSRLLQEPHLRQQTHTRDQLQALQSRGELSRRLKLTLGFFVGFVLVAWLVSVLVGWMVNVLVDRVPLAWEQQLGDSLVQEARIETPFLDDPKLMTRLTNAVAPLLAALPPDGRQYRFYLVDEAAPNAFALPGGHVLVTRGLMNLAERPEELAAVVAHEVAHVTRRHMFRKIISSAGPLVICQLFTGSRAGVLGVLFAGSQLLVAQSFSQEYELEADAVGWNYLVAARIDPRAAPEILRKLQAVEAKAGKFDEPQAFSSHPATEKRIRKLEAKWQKLKNKSGFIQYDSPEPAPSTGESTPTMQRR